MEKEINRNWFSESPNVGLNKDIKSAILSMFKKLKKPSMSKKLKNMEEVVGVRGRRSLVQKIT